MFASENQHSSSYASCVQYRNGLALDNNRTWIRVFVVRFMVGVERVDRSSTTMQQKYYEIWDYKRLRGLA